MVKTATTKRGVYTPFVRSPLPSRPRTVTIVSMMEQGNAVEVRRRFDGGWAPGFEVAEATTAGYRVRRVSDGMVVPAEFSDQEIRAAQ